MEPERVDYNPLPPQNPEAERSVLGTLLQDQNAVITAMETLKSQDFYDPRHQVIFDAVCQVNRLGRAVDLVTVDDELRRAGQIDSIGGTEYLISLIQSVPSTVNWTHYADIVREKSVLRRLIGASGEISRMSYQQQELLPDILNRSEKLIFDIAMRQGLGAELEGARSILTRTYEEIGRLAKLKGGISGVTSGLRDLDKCLTGMHGGELILVGARPSMGKTTLAINIAANAARSGKTVAVFSLEMPREQIMMRILCSEARVDMQAVRSGTLKDKDWDRLCLALPVIAKMPMYVDDTAGISPAQLRSRCRRLILEKGLDLIVIDYLQLMTADGRNENRQLEVSEISRSLKAIALELKVPLIACAQLSRANTQRSDKRPMLSDLRDSGSIEQDADVVMFLHRPSYYDDQADKNVAELIVAKQRNGPLDTIKLNWLPECTMFTDLKIAKQ